MQTFNTEFYDVREESDIDLFVLFLAGLRNLSHQVENKCSHPDQANITHSIITIPESSRPAPVGSHCMRIQGQRESRATAPV